jgi:hypothetical protein
MSTDKNQVPQCDKTAVKCRFFGQYLEQIIAKETKYPNSPTINTTTVLLIAELENYHLELKPIINDTEYKIPDGWEFYKEYTPKEDGYKYDMIWPTKINIGIDQYRTEGYAVPFMDYSVEDLVSFGWVRLV